MATPETRPSLTDALIRKLRQHVVLDAGDVAALESLPFTRKEFGPNAVVARDGERPESCCLVVEGFLFRAKVTEDGKRQILSFHVPGDIPDLQSLHLHVNDHDLVALGATVVGLIPHDAVHALTRAQPKLATAFWRETLVDSAMFRDWLVNVSRRPAPARLAHLLSELARRLTAVGRMQGQEVYLPLTQVHLADALGLTSVHVNRVLRELRRDGVLDLKDRTLRFPDAKRLEQVGAFDPLYLHQKPQL